MNVIAKCTILIMALMLTACDAVFTEQPLGTEIVILDAATWQGSWLGDELVLLTTVLDADQGLLQAAWVERGPEGARFESATGTVRRTGDWIFLNMKRQADTDEADTDTIPEDEDSESERSEETAPLEYYWARVENNGSQVILWQPKVENIRRAVAENRLPGKIKEDEDVVLTALSKEQLAMINSLESDLLSWSEPLVFIRIGD
jgi:hypothetical protein